MCVLVTQSEGPGLGPAGQGRLRQWGGPAVGWEPYRRGFGACWAGSSRGPGGIRLPWAWCAGLRGHIPGHLVPRKAQVVALGAGGKATAASCKWGEGSAWGMGLGQVPSPCRFQPTEVFWASCLVCCHWSWGPSAHCLSSAAHSPVMGDILGLGQGVARPGPAWGCPLLWPSLAQSFLAGSVSGCRICVRKGLHEEPARPGGRGPGLHCLGKVWRIRGVSVKRGLGRAGLAGWPCGHAAGLPES